MKDNLFWLITFILGIPMWIWDKITGLFKKDKEDDNKNTI